jgi:hypothetical protein
MHILFVTKDFSVTSLCFRLKQAGNDVRAFVADRSHRHVLDGLEVGLFWIKMDGRCH